MTPPDEAPPPRLEIPFVEFVLLMALLMALTALSIDIMLVALPDIDRAFAIADPNDRQLVVTAYMLGFAVGQPFYGPLSDRFGRKPILAIGLVVSALGAVGAFMAPDFGALLSSRALQGLGAAAPRVLAVAIVRDRFAGRHMARVMSFVMMVFIIVPVVAPMMGQGLMVLGPWQWIFALLAVVTVLLLAWAGIRLPETRPAEDRLPLSGRALGDAARLVLTTRRTVGYTVATGFMFGGLMTYLGSSQQIFVDVYGLGIGFPLIFGAVASVMAIAAFGNAQLVERLGMRRVSHAALIGYVVACGVLAIMGYPERPPLLGFCIFLAATFFCFSLMMPNFSALAMEPLGHVAGTASSFIGFYTTAAGAFLGWLVGQAFDGSVRPLAIGFTVFGVAALLIVLATERGRLFHSRDDDDAPERGGGE